MRARAAPPWGWNMKEGKVKLTLKLCAGAAGLGRPGLVSHSRSGIPWSASAATSAGIESEEYLLESSVRMQGREILMEYGDLVGKQIKSLQISSHTAKKGHATGGTFARGPARHRRERLASGRLNRRRLNKRLTCCSGVASWRQVLRARR